MQNRVASIHFHREHLPPSELVSQQSKDVKYGSEELWSLLGDEHRSLLSEVCRGRACILDLTLHPNAHRNSVLSISECLLYVTPSSFYCEEAPVFTLSPHYHEQHGKSILVRGPLEFSSPREELSSLYPMPQSFSWRARVDWALTLLVSWLLGPKTCLSGPNPSYLPPLWAKITPPSCSKSKFQLLIKKKKKKNNSEVKMT